jgi:hypothetical protein
MAHRVISGAATYLVAIGRTADIAGFRRALARSQMTDAVEKGHGAVSVRNNRIGSNDLLNRCCAFDACLESMLRGKPSKIFFQQHRPKADVAAKFVNQRITRHNIIDVAA